MEEDLLAKAMEEDPVVKVIEKGNHLTVVNILIKEEWDQGGVQPNILGRDHQSIKGSLLSEKLRQIEKLG